MRPPAFHHRLRRPVRSLLSYVPIYELAFSWGVGPRVEGPGAALIAGFPCSAAFENLRLET